MRVHGKQPTLEHAEKSSAYLPRPEDPHMSEARRIAEDINATKVLDPSTGMLINDQRVDALVEHALAIAKRYEHAPEPREWSCPQRCVWRYAHNPYDHRRDVVEDRTVFSGYTMFASVNAGRWVVQCTFPGCGGAQYASFEDPRFWCVDCENKAVGGKWVGVTWPENPLAVEASLGMRPLTAKNWNPGETAEDIAKQDAEALGAN